MVSQLVVDPTCKGSWYYLNASIPKEPMEKVLGRCTVHKRKRGKDTLGEIGTGTKPRLVHGPHLILLKLLVLPQVSHG